MPSLRSLTLIFCWGIVLSSAQAREIAYTIRPIFDSPNNLIGLKIRLQLAGDADGVTHVQLPFQYGAAADLYHGIGRLQCAGNVIMQMSPDSQQIALSHISGASLDISYEIYQDYSGGLNTTNAFRPIVQSDYFHFIGAAALLIPAISDGYLITCKWEGFPEDWLLHNSFGDGRVPQHWQYQDARWLESVFVGGLHWRLYENEIAQQPVFLAMRGVGWSFSDSLLCRLVQQTVQCQRDFWKDTLIPHYLITLLPFSLQPATASNMQVQSIEYMGAGLQHSFAAFATPLKGFELSAVQHLLHHELMHDWIGGKIRVGGDPNDMQLAWFSEGFTEYFALKNQLDGGFITADAFIKKVNTDFLQALWTSPVRSSPNAAIAAHFFTDPAIQELPYKRGFVFALLLDGHIQRHSKGRLSLHDAMLRFLAYYGDADRNLLDQFDYFQNQLSSLSGLDVGALVQKHIQAGKLFEADQFVDFQTFIMKKGEGGVPVLSQR